MELLAFKPAELLLSYIGADNVNAQVDELIITGVLRLVLAFTELRFSNSMIEAWWRSLKHQCLFLHSLDSMAETVSGVRGCPWNSPWP